MLIHRILIICYKHSNSGVTYLLLDYIHIHTWRLQCHPRNPHHSIQCMCSIGCIIQYNVAYLCALITLTVAIGRQTNGRMMTNRLCWLCQPEHATQLFWYISPYSNDSCACTKLYTVSYISSCQALVLGSSKHPTCRVLPVGPCVAPIHSLMLLQDRLARQGGIDTNLKYTTTWLPITTNSEFYNFFSYM